MPFASLISSKKEQHHKSNTPTPNGLELFFAKNKSCNSRQSDNRIKLKITCKSKGFSMGIHHSKPCPDQHTNKGSRETKW